MLSVLQLRKKFETISKTCEKSDDCWNGHRMLLRRYRLFRKPNIDLRWKFVLRSLVICREAYLVAEVVKSSRTSSHYAFIDSSLVELPKWIEICALVFRVPLLWDSSRRCINTNIWRYPKDIMTTLNTNRCYFQWICHENKYYSFSHTLDT